MACDKMDDGYLLKRELNEVKGLYPLFLQKGMSTGGYTSLGSC